MNVDNDELYEDLNEFLSLRFADIDDFYLKLVGEVYRLQKKYNIRMSPYEYIFIMRNIEDLIFGLPVEL